MSDTGGSPSSRSGRRPRGSFSSQWRSIAVATWLVVCLPAWAAAQTTYFWNGLDPSASPADGGTGTWDGTTLNWRQGSDTGTAVAWPAAGAGTDEAIFAGTAGTVTLSGTQTANQLDFTVTGYTLTGGTLALDGTAPAISVTTGTGTIASPVSGSAGLVKTGAGTLVLSAANTFTGGTTISAGTLQLNAQAAAANGLITLGDAATGASNVQLTLNTNIDRSGFTSAITVANQGTGTATIKWIETGVTGNPSTGNGQITLGRATIFDATQIAGGAYLFHHALSGSGDLSLTSSNGVRFLLQAVSADYTGNITVQNGGIFEPRDNLSSATGNSVTVASGGELRIQFATSSIGGLNGNGIVQSVNSVGTLSVGKNNASGSFAGTLRNNGAVLSLTKTGTGTQILSGTNTYSGATTISGGTLQIGAGGATGTLGPGAVSVGTGATLSFNRSGSLSVANAISGNGSLVQSGPGAVSLTGTNTYAGGTTVTAGILGFSGQASIPGWGTAGAVTVGSGGALAVGNDTSPDDAVAAGYLDPASGLGFDTSAGNRTWTTAITGTRPFVKIGANTLTLAAVNTYSGPTIIAAGTLEFESNSDQTLAGDFSGGGAVRKAGTGTLTLAGAAAYTGATVIDAGTIAFAANADQTLGGAISGVGRLVKAGTGSLTLSAANSYSGGTTVSAGTLILNTSTAGGSGTITLGDAATDTNPVQLTLGTNIDRSGAFNNAITVANQGTGTATIKWIETGNASATGAGTITLDRATTFDATEIGGTAATRYLLFNHPLSGTGDITLTGTKGTRFLLQAASVGYTGNITVQSGGILEPRDKLSAATGNSITVDSGGELRIQFDASTIGGLNGSGSVRPVNAATGALTIGKGDASGSFSGSIGTGVSLTKTGTGTQALSGSSTTASTTTISGGTLRLDTGAALASSTVSLADTAGVTLENTGAAVTIGGLTGGGASGGAVVLTSGTLTVSKASGADTFAGVVSGGGNLTKSGAAVLVLSGANTYSGGTRITAGGLRASDGVGLPTASLLTLDGNAATLQTSGTLNRQMGSASGRIQLTGAGGDGVGFSAVGGPLVVDLQQNGGGGTATWTIGPNPAANQVNISNLLLNDASATHAVEFRNNWNFDGGTRRIRVTATALGTAATASGVLSNGNFEKTGAGTLVLSGNNTHGNTRIVAGGGTLEAAANTALGTGTVTVDAGTTLRLANYATVANTITSAGTVAFAGGGVRRTSTEALATVAGVIAGTAASPVTRSSSFDPTFAWSPRIADTTYSDVLGLTNTAGTIQILEIAYDPSILGSITPADLFLGWDDNGAWVNAIDGNTGSAGGSAVFNQTGSLGSLGILATSDFLGSWGRDTTTNTAWAVIDHNSDFAVIAVPEPATLALLGVAAGLGLASFRRRLRPEVC